MQDLPILILFLVFAGCFVLYYFFVNNEDSYIRKRPEKKGPFDIIYLPEDLDEEKRKQESMRQRGKEEFAEGENHETKGEN